MNSAPRSIYKLSTNNPHSPFHASRRPIKAISRLSNISLKLASTGPVRPLPLGGTGREGGRGDPRLCATAANATYLVPGLIPRPEAVGALRALLERHADEAGRPLVYRDREARNWNYARKRAATALREIAAPDPELLATLRAGLEQVRSWRGRAANEEDRRGLEETLEEIQARE